MTRQGANDDATVDVYDPADVTFTKTADPPDGTIVLPGETITYSLAFTNSTAVTLTDVVLRDELPETVAYDTGTMVLRARARPRRSPTRPTAMPAPLTRRPDPRAP